MLAIREVILDEKLNEVAYVVSGTMQEFGEGEFLMLRNWLRITKM